MNCRGVSRRLSAYIDGELTPGIGESLESHIKICTSCARKLNELRAISEAARSLPPLEVSPGFQQRVLESAVERREKVKVLYGFRARVAFAGMAFVTAAAAVFVIVGPESASVVSNSSDNGTVAESAVPLEDQIGPMDFVNDPTIKIQSFPVPEGSKALEMTSEDSIMLADSSRIDDFILPVVEKTRVNENIKF